MKAFQNHAHKHAVHNGQDEPADFTGDTRFEELSRKCEELQRRLSEPESLDAMIERSKAIIRAIQHRRDEPESLGSMIARSKRELAALCGKHLKPVAPTTSGPGRIPCAATVTKRQKMMRLLCESEKSRDDILPTRPEQSPATATQTPQKRRVDALPSRVKAGKKSPAKSI